MAYNILILADREALSEPCTDTDGSNSSPIIISELRVNSSVVSRSMEENMSVDDSLTMSEPVQCSDKGFPTDTLCITPNVGVCSSQVSLHACVYF